MKKFFKNLRYFLEYFLIRTVLSVLKICGINKSVSICRYLARKIGPLLPVSKIAHQNIKDILGSTVDSAAIVDQVWDNFGSFIGEFPYVSNMSEDELLERVKIEGVEHIVKFQELHKPFVLFTGHFANWDFALKILNRLYPKFAIIYRKANNPYVNQLINDARIGDNIKLIAKGARGARDLIAAIKSQYAIGMLVDQKMNDGIEVPFLGQPAMTANAIAKIALDFDYPIVPLQIIRTNNSHFKVIIHPPLEVQNTKNHKVDHYSIMLKINTILGDWVKEYPGQWFWFHNRWKKNHARPVPK